MTLQTICVYCGSSDKMGAHYLEAARKMGAAIARRGLAVVYGAGSTGLMGAVADGALEAGGEVIGIIPEIFNTPILCHQSLTRLEVVQTIHIRKARLAELADAFIALPGGFGTFEELFEMLTWAQIGLHTKPVGLLNTRSYYEPLLTLIEHARNEGFIYDEHRALLTHAEKPEELLDALSEHRHPGGLERWLSRDDDRI
jgi:uncharacterized protein (TIGR00730 family)